MRLLLCVVLTGACSAVLAADFSARLQTRLSSYASATGSEFRATVVSPAIVDGKVSIPEGAVLFGRVLRARSIGVGLVHERAELNLDIYAYRLADGTVVPCSAQVTDVDNSRETTTSDGRIRGILAAGGASGLARGIWRMPTQAILHRPATRLTGIGTTGFGPLLSMGLLTFRWVALRFPEPEIDFPAGTELILALTSRAAGAPDFAPDLLPHLPAGEWASLPRDVMRPNGKPSDDVINMIFSGTRQQVAASFAAAGWVQADPLNRSTFLRMYKAWVGMKGYPAAPVSRLLYEDREPDLVFQKSLNTVARRHHIRIWQVPGRQQWVAAATHDIAIGFDFGPQMMTHRIDLAVDRERSRVLTDLRAAGCIGSAAFVPASLPDTWNRQIQTDGGLLRLELEACTPQPGLPASTMASHKPGNAVSRMARRFALETRHYVVRDNGFYWGFVGVRAATRLLRHPKHQPTDVDFARRLPSPAAPPPAGPPLKGM